MRKYVYVVSEETVFNEDRTAYSWHKTAFLDPKQACKYLLKMLTDEKGVEWEFDQESGHYDCIVLKGSGYFWFNDEDEQKSSGIRTVKLEKVNLREEVRQV